MLKVFVKGFFLLYIFYNVNRTETWLDKKKTESYKKRRKVRKKYFKNGWMYKSERILEYTKKSYKKVQNQRITRKVEHKL